MNAPERWTKAQERISVPQLIDDQPTIVEYVRADLYEEGCDEAALKAAEQVAEQNEVRIATLEQERDDLLERLEPIDVAQALSGWQRLAREWDEYQREVEHLRTRCDVLERKLAQYQDGGE